ncbi:cbb3-type cytochrome c oxidase subunit 3 [Vogesella sp. LIG4]|uniref:cbb3-type cytochrome oxidase subunit 3 n=1 Tax=Vogesella sp. LIG4 TaxID=1192162 RepID=UPI00081FEC82|nr:cbb3-type cytochrome c oxidase subunit 3 [Vogesella sp. LIG4]SCK05821.1 cytochrome c oxidase cbb3-type subunit 4 [Vogesella sp. LIG4]
MELTNLARTLFTVFCFTLFVVVVVGAFGKKSKKRYDEAANLVFDDEDKQPNKPDASNGA